MEKCVSVEEEGGQVKSESIRNLVDVVKAV